MGHFRTEHLTFLNAVAAFINSARLTDDLAAALAEIARGDPTPMGRCAAKHRETLTAALADAATVQATVRLLWDDLFVAVNDQQPDTTIVRVTAASREMVARAVAPAPPQ